MENKTHAVKIEQEVIKLENDQERIAKALDIIYNFGGVDGSHHKMWVIDQVVRALTGSDVIQKTHTNDNGFRYTWESMGDSEDYLEWVKKFCDGEDGPKTYEWDCGINP